MVETMTKLLVIVDMQNDFITGSLANTEGQKIVDKIVDYAGNFEGNIVATQDTHTEEYLKTQEGQHLPVEHCISGTEGWEIVPKIEKMLQDRSANSLYSVTRLNKPTFGSTGLGELVKDGGYTEVELCGVCTDICVISNALLIKAFVPEVKITVLKELCAGVTPESHETALKAMQSCQINIV